MDRPNQPLDRRIQRTRQLLRDALFARWVGESANSFLPAGPIGGPVMMVRYLAQRGMSMRDAAAGVTVSTTPGEGLEDAHDLLVSYRAGDVLAPQLGVSEALSSVAQHFAECVREGRRPLTDGTAGLRVIRLLEAAEQSLADGGTAVELR